MAVPIEVFDRKQFMNRVMDDEEFARELIEQFFVDLPQQVASIKQAVAVSDYTTVSHQGHSIKGAAANLGASILQRCCRDLETAGKNEDFSQITSQISDLDQAVEELRQRLVEERLLLEPTR